MRRRTGTERPGPPAGAAAALSPASAESGSDHVAARMIPGMSSRTGSIVTSDISSEAAPEAFVETTAEAARISRSRPLDIVSFTRRSRSVSASRRET